MNKYDYKDDSLANIRKDMSFDNDMITHNQVLNHKRVSDLEERVSSIEEKNGVFQSLKKLF